VSQRLPPATPNQTAAGAARVPAQASGATVLLLLEGAQTPLLIVPPAPRGCHTVAIHPRPAPTVASTGPWPGSAHMMSWTLQPASPSQWRMFSARHRGARGVITARLPRCGWNPVSHLSPWSRKATSRQIWGLPCPGPGVPPCARSRMEMRIGRTCSQVGTLAVPSSMAAGRDMDLEGINRGSSPGPVVP